MPHASQAKSTTGSETPHLCGLEGTKTHSFQPLQRECLAVELPGTPCSHVPLHSKHGDMPPPQRSAASCVRLTLPKHLSKVDPSKNEPSKVELSKALSRFHLAPTDETIPSYATNYAVLWRAPDLCSLGCCPASTSEN